MLRAIQLVIVGSVTGLVTLVASLLFFPPPISDRIEKVLYYPPNLISDAAGIVDYDTTATLIILIFGIFIDGIMIFGCGWLLWRGFKKLTRSTA